MCGQLREHRGDVPPAAALEPDPPAVHEGDGAGAVPLDLVGPGLGPSGEGAEHGQHRLDRRRDRIGQDGLAVAVDHPVLAVGLEEHEVARGPRAVQHELHLGVGPLLGSRRCPCPRCSWCRRRTRPPGCRPRRWRTRAGGPRCARPGGSAWDRPAGPWAAPTRRARRRARGAGPSAVPGRGAPGSRNAGRRLRSGRGRCPWVRASWPDRAWPGRCAAPRADSLCLRLVATPPLLRRSTRLDIDPAPNERSRVWMTDSPDEVEVPEDEASRESFPASDPPSSWSGEDEPE